MFASSPRAPSARPALRPAAEVMSPARAACAVPTALSFTRAAIGMMLKRGWRVEKLRVDLDEEGRGEVLYRLDGDGWSFHYFVLSNSFPAEMKIDRNFGTNWDAMAVLCQGEWTARREEHLRREMPKGRAGITDYDTLIYARGNRSGRLFDKVVEALADGRQPDGHELARVGYILRTTAFIGNGAMGTRPLRGFGNDHPLRRPYYAQMCAGFLLREYVYDVVDAMARARSRKAVPLCAALRRYLGLGNSAATGLVPFVVHRPKVIAQWCRVQEEAFAQARSRTVALDDPLVARFDTLITRAATYHEQDAREFNGIFATSMVIAGELRLLAGLRQEIGERLAMRHGRSGGLPLWEQVYLEARASCSPATVEMLLSILLELYPDLVEIASGQMEADERADVDPAMPVRRLQDLIDERYAWTRQFDLSLAAERHYFWYRSKQAPLDMRRGVRGLMPKWEAEMGTDALLRLHELRAAIADMPAGASTAELLIRYPELRFIVTRVQSLADLDYAEFRTNYLSRGFSPYGPLRMVLAFYGMEKMEASPPKSVRGAFLQGAPTAEDIAAGQDGVWPFPLVPEAADAAAAPAALPGASAAAMLAGPTPGVVDDSGQVRVSPTEIERFAQRALQGHGVSFGASQAGARAVVFTQQLFGTGLGTLLQGLRSGAIAHRPPLAWQARPWGVELAVQGVSSFHAACDALDLATAHARRSAEGCGVAIVKRATDLAVLDHLPVQAAARGLKCALLWHVPTMGEERPGFFRSVVSGPGVDGPWLATATFMSPSVLHTRLRALFTTCPADPAMLQEAIAKLGDLFDPSVAAAAFARDREAWAGLPSFVLAVWAGDRAGPLKPSDMFERFAVPAGSCVSGTDVAMSGQDLARWISRSLTKGEGVALGDWRSLNAAAASVLVSNEDEEMIRPEGHNPQVYL